jgi:hypothetical protein
MLREQIQESWRLVARPVVECQGQLQPLAGPPVKTWSPNPRPRASRRIGHKSSGPSQGAAQGQARPSGAFWHLTILALRVVVSFGSRVYTELFRLEGRVEVDDQNVDEYAIQEPQAGQG